MASPSSTASTTTSRTPTGFRAVCQQGLEMGFDGKTLIHPSQVEPCNEIFAPSAAELEMAGKIVAAFKAAQAEGKGVVTVDGRMIENLHVEQAERALALAVGHQGAAGRGMSKTKTETGQLLRGLPRRPGVPPRHAAHADRGRCRAECRALRLALRHQFLGRVRACARPAARAARRPAGLPCRDRQDRDRHLAQCRGQSRLCRVPLGRAGLSRRHAVGALDGARPAREFQQGERRRLGALDRHQPEGRDGAGLRALGDGAQARSAGGGRRAGRAEDRAVGGAGRPDRAGRTEARRLRRRRGRLARIAGRTTSPANASTM